MGKITTRKVMYGVVGETAGRTIVATWNWLWGLPVESGGKIAEKVALDSLHSMQESVLKLTEAVAKVVAAYEQAKQVYNGKRQEVAEAERKAQLAQKAGNQEAAKLAMTQVIIGEKVLPQLAEQVNKAEQLMKASKEKLSREREKLEALKLEMTNLKAIREMSTAMQDIFDSTTDLDMGSAQEQFNDAKDAIERRNLFENAKAELAENPAKQIESQLEQLGLDDEIARRLAKLD